MGVLLVLLVVALWAQVALLGNWLARARSGPSGATFPCRVRPAGRLGHVLPGGWPRRRWRGTWVHDVLLLERGVLMRRITSLRVRIPEEALRDAWPGEVRGLGRDVVVVLLRLDDGSLVEVAATSEHRTHLVGPFGAAAIPGVPPTPGERPNLGC
jgi:hypothetical protein